MKNSTTPAGVRCSECGAEPGDPNCYTADDGPTSYHAARRQSADLMRAELRQHEAGERRARAAERATVTDMRKQLAALRAENRRLLELLAMVGDLARAAKATAPSANGVGSG